MKKLVVLVLILIVVAYFWALSPRDTSSEFRNWAEAWIAGAIAHVDDLLQHNAELKVKIDRLEAEEDSLKHQISQLQDENDALHRDLSIALSTPPKVCPPTNKPRPIRKMYRCSIANELNTSEAISHRR